MLAASIVDAIRVRRNRIRERCRNGAPDPADRRLVEEFDSLLDEVEALRHAHHHAHSHPPPIQFPEDRSDEWILGDQGQKGG